MSSKDSVKERFVAAMVLSGVGDAMGYKNGNWEFCHSGEQIHSELEELGGVENLTVKLPSWPVSDDTVMHLATAEGLMDAGKEEDKEKMYALIAREYKYCWGDMGGRAPGITCSGGVHQLRPDMKNGYCIPFNKRGGGCGAAMRAMCIGLRYSKTEEEDDLIAVSVESGRMTHHHPTGYLGGLAAALFTAYAIREIPIVEWGFRLLNTLPKAMKYVETRLRYVKENVEAWPYFLNAWNKYLTLRGIKDGAGQPRFPKKYGIIERDAFYKTCSYSGWGGSSGHDAPMIAYDALLGAGDNWADLCSRSMFHSGDSDSTGVIAACCYGAMFGFKGVPEGNYRALEYRSRLEKAGRYFFGLATGEDDSAQSTEQRDLKNSIPDTADSTTDENSDSENDSATAGPSSSLETEQTYAYGHGDGSIHIQDTVDSDSDVATHHPPVKRDSTMSQGSGYDADSESLHTEKQEKQRKLKA